MQGRCCTSWGILSWFPSSLPVAMVIHYPEGRSTACGMFALFVGAGRLHILPKTLNRRSMCCMAKKRLIASRNRAEDVLLGKVPFIVRLLFNIFGKYIVYTGFQLSSMEVSLRKDLSFGDSSGE